MKPLSRRSQEYTVDEKGLELFVAQAPESALEKSGPNCCGRSRDEEVVIMDLVRVLALLGSNLCQVFEPVAVHRCYCRVWK